MEFQEQNNPALHYFDSQFHALEKKCDVKHLETIIDNLYSGSTLSLEKETTGMWLRFQMRSPPIHRDLFPSRLPDDCIKYIQDYTCEQINVLIHMDLRSPLQNIYAYPYHSFDWKLVNVTHNMGPEYNLITYFQSKVLFHNRYNHGYNNWTPSTTIDQDIARFCDRVNTEFLSNLLWNTKP